MEHSAEMSDNTVMAYTDKYYKKNCLDARPINPVKHCVLTTFESVYDGTADFSRVFNMITDEYVREYVDDEDYAFWLEQKALYAKE